MGPDADTCVLFEPEGIRISCPPTTRGGRLDRRTPRYRRDRPGDRQGRFRDHRGLRDPSSPERPIPAIRRRSFTLDVSSDRVGHATTTLSWRVQKSGPRTLHLGALGEERQMKNVWTRLRSQDGCGSRGPGNRHLPRVGRAGRRDVHAADSVCVARASRWRISRRRLDGRAERRSEVRVTDIVVRGQSLSQTTQTAPAPGSGAGDEPACAYAGIAGTAGDRARRGVRGVATASSHRNRGGGRIAGRTVGRSGSRPPAPIALRARHAARN